MVERPAVPPSPVLSPPVVSPPVVAPSPATRRRAGRDGRPPAALLAGGAVAGGAAMAASLAVAPGWGGLLAAAAVPVLAAIAVIDARRFLIPDGLNAAALGLGLAHGVAVAGLDGGLAAGLRGAVLGLVFLGLRRGYRALRGREGLGLGDVKLAGVAGAWLGVSAIPVAIELAALAALLGVGARQVLGGR
ncbi:A24 family peptidase, partial [Xanthobacter sp. V4C-4]|uniref:prepilin peptidase n=1 Tax=Xanthobacter cornucopiae TaxID=3119924 RepID=UPI00372A885B